jgi:hypothetical protein
MAKSAGRFGYVGASTAIAGINQWSLDYTVDMLETTDFAASGVAAYIPGVSRWSGSFSGFKDGTPQALASSAVVNLCLSPTSASTTAYQGTAFISGVHPTTNHDGIVSYNYDFQGTDSCSIPTA